jgi:transposase-like protein
VHQHGSARLSVHSRHTIAVRVLEQGCSISEAARQAAVSRQTASKWVARYRAEGQVGVARPLDAAPSDPPSGTRARRAPDRAVASTAPRVPSDRLDAASREFHGLPGPFAGSVSDGFRVWNLDPIPTATSGLTR